MRCYLVPEQQQISQFLSIGISYLGQIQHFKVAQTINTTFLNILNNLLVSILGSVWGQKPSHVISLAPKLKNVLMLKKRDYLTNKKNTAEYNS